MKWLVETSRLGIRLFTPEDWPEVYSYVSDPEVMAFIPGGILSESETRDFICKNISGDVRNYPVVHKTENRIIGHMVWHPWYSSQVYEIGWVFHKSYHNQGLGTEAARALMNYGFAVTGLHRVISTCQPNNPPSWRVMEKLGMRREGHFQQCIFWHDGTWWDEYFYAVLREEWLLTAGQKKE